MIVYEITEGVCSYDGCEYSIGLRDTYEKALEIVLNKIKEQNDTKFPDEPREEQYPGEEWGKSWVWEPDYREENTLTISERKVL